ncbi:DNA damage-repair/toleration protein DRT100-like [Amaranthus tricolor]|uniref:DNA damage-repair/toleration protein DRT100-like n=1 Tax=Amaranthus tricolor TaxID=29722 RepID=UPI002585B6AA|nr:DNA damage-repair/toleration protein DRT100-like [Amaranthus tricolor]
MGGHLRVQLQFDSPSGIPPPCDTEAELHHSRKGRDVRTLGLDSRIEYDTFQRLASWVPKTDCCTIWDGVECDPSTGRVVKIVHTGIWDESGAETVMSGTLSPFLGNLTYLQVLNLCALGGLAAPIPTDLGKLSQLKNLYLNHNKISGSIPFSFGKLSQLQIYISTTLESMVLDISHNKLKGILPNTIGNLFQIQRIVLENKKISGKLPPSIGKLNPLYDILLSNDLFLANNRLISPLPPQLTTAKIYILDLSYNPLGLAKLPNWIFNRTTFHNLTLAEAGIKGQLPESILISYIAHLDLSSNQLTGKLPSWIGRMTILTVP